MAKILTVEDDKFTRDFIKEILDENGFETLAAEDSDGCFDLLNNNPDTLLVLLDIMLPGRSGWDIFSELRRKYPHVKVVFVSAIEVSDERRSSLEREGLAGYLVKPFTEESLKKMIRDVLNINSV